MEWQDDAIVLENRAYGENGSIAGLFTRAGGRHAGLVRGGAGKKLGPVLMPGNRVCARWRGRSEDQLGSYTVELVRPHAALLMDRADALSALQSATVLLGSCLGEREAHPELFDGTAVMLDHLAGPAWAAGYIRWELGLLEALGYGLRLSECAATGGTDGLIYVSPKSGQAVSRQAGAPYRDKMLPLPAFLGGADQGLSYTQQLLAGLELTGWFIAHRLVHRTGTGAPQARELLVRRLRRQCDCGEDKEDNLPQ